MKNRATRTSLVLGILCLMLAAWLPSNAQAPQAPDRYLDRVPESGAGIRLAVFNPEVFNIKALEALRKNGILDVPNLTVIGVYHVKQTGKFEESRKHVEENKLDWFKFHEVSGEIGEPDVFKTNACSAEFEKIVRKTDGVIFFGGPDIPPAVFGKKTNLLTDITDPYRHYLEVSAVFHVLGGSRDPAFKALLDAKPKFAVLGICLGFQTLNVGTGGTLIQDIWSELYGKDYVEDVIALGPEQWHNNPYRLLYPLDKLMGYNFHSLELSGQGLFCTAMGFKSSDHPRILSSHHQAVDALGRDLIPIATSRDGKIIEAVAHRKYPAVLGVQFHPEHYLLWDTEPRHRQKPGDPLTSFNAILTGTPPSLEFNKAIWKWFAGRLVASHGK